MTADLVDSSAPTDVGEFTNLTLDKIAETLVKPYGIRVISQAKFTKPIQTFSLQNGESVFNALERASRLQNINLQTSADGDLVLTQVGEIHTPIQLEQGKNILSVKMQSDFAKRYHTYVIQSQGNDFLTSSTNAEGKAIDASIKRNRTLVINAENASDQEDANARATWEMTTRLAKSLSLSVTVADFSYNNVLWEINRLIKLSLPLMKIDNLFLIQEVTYSLNEQGLTTELKLTNKDAFKTFQPPMPKNSYGWW